MAGSKPIRRTAASFTFLDLDRDSAEPMYVQLYTALRDAIVSGRIRPGTLLPSTRAIADDLGISRNTAANAFDQLTAEGYLVGRLGSGTYVADALPEDCVLAGGDGQRAVEPSGVRRIARRCELLADRTDAVSAPGEGMAFRISVPALDAFPRDTWTRLIARTRNVAPREMLDYGEPGGYRPLREAISEYVRVARGVRCTTEQVVVVSGSQQAIAHVARMVLDQGDAAFVEDPGYPGAFNALVSVGARVVAVPIDEEGIRIADGVARDGSARLAYVSPSHQFPLGVTTSPARRRELVEWAQAAGAWIFEDDYDSEYRYSSRPLPSLQGTDPYGRVVHFGTFSKVLFPALRLGYVVLPEDLVEPFLGAQFAEIPPTFEQMVLADFIREGHFYRHVRRMRALYARRQAALVREARQVLGRALELEPADAGMYLVGRLREGVSDVEISRAASERGVSVLPLSAFYLEAPPANGLLVGYAAVAAREMRAGLKRLRHVLE